MATSAAPAPKVETAKPCCDVTSFYNCSIGKLLPGMFVEKLTIKGDDSVFKKIARVVGSIISVLTVLPMVAKGVQWTWNAVCSKVQSKAEEKTEPKAEPKAETKTEDKK